MIRLNVGEAEGKLVALDRDELVKHCVVLGQTGSGKTGFVVRLMEELACAGEQQATPIIAIDVKGDLANFGDVGDVLALNRETDRDFVYYPRIALAKQDVAIYTPKISLGGGLGLSANRGMRNNGEKGQREVVRQLLTRAYGKDVDFLDEKYVYLEKCLEILEGNERTRNVVEYRLIDCAEAIEAYGGEYVGTMKSIYFFPEARRRELAIRLTSVLESKEWKSWSEGEPLDVNALFVNRATNRPRVSIVSLAHLSDEEKNFFLPLLLSEIVAAMRRWQGTDKLRAVLVVDDCFGLLPPMANPPSKSYLLTLLKQGRAYGLGLVLGTQNPADLDYRALSQVGTWAVGRLRTKRDQERVSDVLSGYGMEGELGKLELREFALASAGGVQVKQGACWKKAPGVFVRSLDTASRLIGPMTLRQIEQRMAWRTLARIEGGSMPQGREAILRWLNRAGVKAAIKSLMPDAYGLLVTTGAEGEKRKEQIGKLWSKSIRGILKRRMQDVRYDLLIRKG